MSDLVTGDHQEFFEIPNIIKSLICVHKYIKPQKAAASKISGSPEKTLGLGQVRNETISTESLSLRKNSRKPRLINWKYGIKVD